MIRKAVFCLTVLVLYCCGSAVGEALAADMVQNDFLANLRTLPARSAFSLDLDRRLIFTRRQAIAHFDAKFKDRSLREYSVWALGNVRLLNIHKNEGGFNAFSNGAQAGIDFLNGGGVFGAYRKIDAFYDDSLASGQEIEAGLYKYFFDINFLGLVSAFNVWGALAFSNFNVDNRIMFNSRALKGGFEADFGRAIIVPFLGARGGYASNGSASDRDGFIMGEDDYLRAEILGGFKTILELRDFVFNLKAYGGFLPIGASEEIKVKNRGENVIMKTVEEEKFFGGAALLTQWSIADVFSISLLGGAETDMNGAIGFYGNFALNYKFMKSDIKRRKPIKPEKVVEKKVDGAEKLDKYKEAPEPDKSKEEVNEEQFIIIFDDKTGKPNKIIKRK